MQGGKGLLELPDPVAHRDPATVYHGSQSCLFLEPQNRLRYQ
jgi:hypothetical protein